MGAQIYKKKQVHEKENRQDKLVRIPGGVFESVHAFLEST